MCGFAGVVAWEDQFRVTRETLSRMSAAVAHRGPDGEGLYLNHENEVTPDRPQVGLVHRRLAILDPDPRANQPFTDEQGRWIVFNGEIYNFRELRDELSKLKPDYAWRTLCDTEVLLVAYDVWGEKCVERLNGMFAFAVWDEPKQELFLARDRMGQKPLFIGFPSPGRPLAVAFASELNAVRAVPWFSAEIDQSRLRDYLQYGYFPCPTAYQHAITLRPGRWWKLVNPTFAHGISGASYFDPNRPINLVTTEDAIAQTRRLVLQSVERQLIADVPIGCLLSGGIDSSVVAAAMRAAVSRDLPVHTFSIGFDDKRYDESEYAASVAAHLGTTHERFIVRPDAVNDLAKLSAVFGQPFGDSSTLPTHYLAREVRQRVKVALSGDGGDELFGGYDRYRAMRMGQRLDAIPRPLRAMIAARVWQRIPGSHPKSMPARLKRFLASSSLDPANRYAAYVQVFGGTLLDALWPPGDRPAIDEAFHVKYNLPVSRWLLDDFEKLSADRDPVQTALAVDRISYLPGDLLTKLDHASMLHALEVRSPFMDHELVQFAAGLTTDQLIGGSPKRMLREAFAQDLPAWVFKRKKMGFAVPIGEWFRGELRSMLRDHLFASDSFASSHFNRGVLEKMVDEHERSVVDHSQRLYALLMLELWWKADANSKSQAPNPK